MSRIFVRNFGPIHEADININRLTLLIGEQASGKSTLAKLVYFFKSLKEQLVGLALLDTPTITASQLINVIRDQFYVFFGSTKRFPEGYRVEFHLGEGRSITCAGSPLQVDINPQDWFNDLLGTVQNYTSRIGAARDRNDLGAEARERVAYHTALARLFLDPQENLYIPASRNITVAYSASFLAALREELRLKSDSLTPGKRNDAKAVDLIIARDFISHVQQVRERFLGQGMEGFLQEMPPRMSELLIPRIQKLLKGQYRYTSNIGEHFHIPGRGNVLLEHASSGQQESIRILQDVLVSLSENRNIFRIIEEPEAHLFPSGQRVLMEILAALSASSTQSSLFITTHSPYILSVINNLLYAAEVPDPAAVEAGFPDAIRLQRGTVSAYMITGDGVAQSMLDAETGLIGANLIEDAWDEIDYAFQHLYTLDD
ncbi:MAG: AAA family ATPase [Bacteroidia bacterium]|nr:AAA family ATPase [Bacteroidia bacterium]